MSAPIPELQLQHAIRAFFQDLVEVPKRRPEIDLWHERMTGRLIQILATGQITLEELVGALLGILAWQQSDITPERAHHQLIECFGKTGGLFHELLALLVLKCRRPDVGAWLEEPSAFFPGVTAEGVDRLATELGMEGYARLPWRLDGKTLDYIRALAITAPCRFRDPLGERAVPARGPVDLEQPGSATAWVEKEFLVGDPIIRALISDPVLRSVVGTYLGTDQEKVRNVALWWSFPDPEGVARDDSAQMYHYDLDDFRWLKLFVYVNEVGMDNGPHVYWPGTHRPGRKSMDLLRRGYVRITDEEMAAHQMGAPVPILGEAGTLVLGDTKCWHKGLPPVAGRRLLLQIQFSVSSFQERFG